MNNDHETASTTDSPPPGMLRREVGVFGAVMMGLGSIVGTGVFVSIGIAAGVAGPAVVLAIAVAALVATCNGLSSAQLAASCPISGGTYEYGYRWLSPRLGFTAGWMFLCAKSASAATAALGFAGYALNLLQLDDQVGRAPVAFAAVILLTALLLAGLRRTNAVNIAIVSVTLLALATFVAAGFPAAWQSAGQNLTPLFAPVSSDHSAIAGFLQACALMFVAYTGYGRIATLGEEITEPRRNIPRAIIATLLVSMTLYMAVGAVAIASVGAPALSEATRGETAPLARVAAGWNAPAVRVVVAIGAVTAMIGVLLNLLLGLSRVALAMGRRRDLPPLLGRINEKAAAPTAAVVFVGLAIAGLTLIGDVKTTWSFSAFTVLIYYLLTNLAALRLNARERLYPKWIAAVGLIACAFLAFWVEQRVWLTGLALIVAGLLWQQTAQRIWQSKSNG